MEMRNMNYTEDLSVSNINDNKFELTLSVSTVTVATKEEAKKVVDFQKQAFIAEPGSLELEHLFTTQLYSTNLWSSGCSNAAYIGMTGVTLDFDHGYTIDEAQQAFADYNYILHTSRTHQYSEDNNLGEDRFRVILPFEPGVMQFTSASEAAKVYYKLMTLYPKADQACSNPGRKFFPSTRELNTPFLLDVHVSGKYFSMDVSDVPVVKPFVQVNYIPPTELDTHEELYRMLKFDKFIPWCQGEASNGLPEPLWHAMISNLCRFEGGRELIHEISAKDPVIGRYDFDETEDKIQHALESSGPIGYEEIVKRGWSGVAPVAPLAPAGFAKIGSIQNRKSLFASDKNPDIYLKHDDWILVDDKGILSAIIFGDLKQKVKEEGCTVSAVCPFCDTDGAKIRTNTFHFAYLHCEQCNRSYWEHPDSPELFSYNGELLRIEMKGNKFISHEKLKPVNFRNGLEWDYACKAVMNDPKRRFIGDSFTINRIGDASFGELGYEMLPEENSVVFEFPAIGVDVQDNAFIDRFLDRMFRDRADFVKNWMALYAYTNYVSLPVIVLTGPRSCGKNTFADLVGEIFPSLKATWDGDKEQFNDFAKAKLVFVDENRHSDKPVQYAEIKRLTGSRTIKINEKHIRQYYVRNNAKFIFATNDPRPIALHWREEPESEKTNNFFIYSCPAVSSDDIDGELFDKLKARLGHYVRTELKKRFEAWKQSGNANTRYALKTPITDLAKQLFGASKSLIELEAEELAQYLVCGYQRNDGSLLYPKTYSFSPVMAAGGLYVQQQDLRELVQKLNFKGHSNYKSYITVLQDHGVLSYKNDNRVSGQRLGYQILRKPEYYTTASGSIAAEEGVITSSAGLSICHTTSSSNGRVVFE